MNFQNNFSFDRRSKEICARKAANLRFQKTNRGSNFLAKRYVALSLSLSLSRRWHTLIPPRLLFFLRILFIFFVLDEKRRSKRKKKTRIKHNPHNIQVLTERSKSRVNARKNEISLVKALWSVDEALPYRSNSFLSSFRYFSLPFSLFPVPTSSRVFPCRYKNE